MATSKPTSIDDYNAGFPKETQTVLNQVREAIKNAVPEAEETISYAIPAFIVNKTYLVYFAGYKHHISLYPAPKGSETFEKEIAGYRSGKGTIQFPIEKPLPLALVTKIVRYNLKENVKRQKDH